MMMKQILSFLIVVLFLASCKNSENNKDTQLIEENQIEADVNQVNTEEEKSWYKPQIQVIKGEVVDGANANIILDKLSIGEITPIISVLVNEDNTFRIETVIKEPAIYQLRFTNGNIHLFLRGDTVTVNTDISDLGSYEVIGSDESVRLRDMYLMLGEINHKTTSLQARVDKLKENKKNNRALVALIDSLPIYYAKINEERSQKIQAFIKDQDTSMVALLAAMYLNADKNYDFLVELREKFSEICPHSSIYKKFDDKVSLVIPVGKGSEAPEIVLNDYEGKEQALSNLKGNYTLLFFWAAYSNPCMSDIVKLKEIYNQYQNNDFKIFAISLDEEAVAWKNAVLDNGIQHFTHGSNLVGWEDEISFIYKIEGVPYYVLVDKEGIIIERGFNVYELEQILETLF